MKKISRFLIVTSLLTFFTTSSFSATCGINNFESSSVAQSALISSSIESNDPILKSEIDNYVEVLKGKEIILLEKYKNLSKILALLIKTNINKKKILKEIKDSVELLSMQNTLSAQEIQQEIAFLKKKMMEFSNNSQKRAEIEKFFSNQLSK